MRHRSPFAFAGVFLIILLGVMGFAAFSATPTETAQTADGVVLPPTASGRVAGSVLGAQLATSVTPVPTEAPRAPADETQTTPVTIESTAGTVPTTQATTPSLELAPEAARFPDSPASPEAADAAETTPTAPPTTTTAPPTTTTAPPTTTTAPPTTTTTPPTTTTAPPTTTTTAPPTTTTAPPDTTEPPVVHPPEVEQWRGLVGAYWPDGLIDDALSVIDCESNGDASAVNPSSGAAGLFQFLPSTWDSAAAQAGWAGANVLDPEANIAVAYWLFSQYAEPWQQWNCKP